MRKSMPQCIVLFLAGILFFLACESGNNTSRRGASNHGGSTLVKGTGNNEEGPNGFEIFKAKCKICHGAKGNMGMNGAKDLTASSIDLDTRIEIIMNGQGAMTPFRNILKPEEIQAVAEYTMKFNKNLK